MSQGPVTTSIDDGVLVVRIDDGKANALSHDVLKALDAALDEASDGDLAVCFVGREGKLCAGFDLSVMTQGGDATRGLVQAGGEFLMRLYGFGQATTVAATGHALAAGALFLLACDTRIGPIAPAKIGLNEVAIGMALPRYGVELARERLDPRHFTRAVVQAEIYSPEDAVEAGYLDRVVPVEEVERVAIGEARRLGELTSQAYRTTKRQCRGDVIKMVLEGIEADMELMVPPSG